MTPRGPSEAWRSWVLIGILGGMTAALRVPFAIIPSVQPSTALIVLAGQAMGARIGLGVGIATPLLSNLLLGHGPWTPWQVLGWGLVGLLSGLLPRLPRWALAAWGVAASLLFGIIVDAWIWVGFATPRNLTTLIPVLARGLPFNLMHAAATATVLLAVGPRLDALLSRGRVRILGRAPRRTLAGSRTLTTTVKTQPRSEGVVADGTGPLADTTPNTSGSRRAGKKERRPKKLRPHPYADEQSTKAELDANAMRITLLWGIGSLLMVGVGYWLQTQHGYFNNQATRNPEWEMLTQIPLFAGLALLAFGYFENNRAARKATLVGWILFGAYWALTARDLFVQENSDYVNMTFAMVGVFALNYLAYHEWLSLARGVKNTATKFLAVSVFIAAGTYFLIAKVTPLRIWLIERVGEQTKASLDWFGLGTEKGLQFHIDKVDIFGPVLFHYPDTYCNASRTDPIGDYCETLPAEQQYITTYPAEPTNWFQELIQYAPDGDLRIIPVSIILACTAIQSIMLFVGLFFGTEATLKRKIVASTIVGAIIYALNLLRNTLVIWAYGRGHMSFFMVHNVLAKLLSLGALIGIAFAAFKYFPEFFKSLGSVLDLPHRDGPIERTLNIGRRRPDREGGSAGGSGE